MNRFKMRGLATLFFLKKFLIFKLGEIKPRNPKKEPCLMKNVTWVLSKEREKKKVQNHCPQEGRRASLLKQAKPEK